MKSKICGISDSKTLKYLIEHPNPPDYIGFIVNYPKSKRFVDNNKLKELLKIEKKNSKYVAVLVGPDTKILEEIKIPRQVGISKEKPKPKDKEVRRKQMKYEGFTWNFEIILNNSKRVTIYIFVLW